MIYHYHCFYSYHFVCIHIFLCFIMSDVFFRALPGLLRFPHQLLGGLIGKADRLAENVWKPHRDLLAPSKPITGLILLVYA